MNFLIFFFFTQMNRKENKNELTEKEKAKER